ncbi:MAG: hypothetical protein LBB46_01645, partial [Coriobacteriaceae bacterium]|nr:hypothetical protein [Coriobacteriaceae bacterium]
MRRPRTASAAHPTNMRVLVGIVFATGIAVMLLAGCGSGSPASGQKPPSRGSVDPAGATVTPGSYDEVFDTISTIFENRDAVYGLGRGLEAFAEADDAAPAAPSPNIASDVAQEAGGGYSGTNVQ